jgi:hydroxymethylpyrimidine/phosphomethylpyrimidine kinase
VHEALVLAGKTLGAGEVSRTALEEASKAIAGLGAKAVLIKGGHLVSEATDLLFVDGRFHAYPGKRVNTRHTHGTGCTYSAAITAELAKGTELSAAIAAAKEFITRAIATNYGLGHGFGPVNHFTPVTPAEGRNS